MASTARSTVPHAVISTTGSSGSAACSVASASIPSCPDVVSRVKFMSSSTAAAFSSRATGTTRDGSVSPNTRQPCCLKRSRRAS